MALTGAITNLASITVNDGLATAGATSVALNVGNNTSSGTVGAIPINLNPDGFKNAVVRFDRTDGYTLGAPVTTIGATAANYVRSFVDSDSQGTGFSDGGFAINLGSTFTAGGQFRVGLNRPNATGNISGALSAGQILMGAGQAGATLNFNNGATVNVDYFTIGNATNVGGTVNQAAGTTVNVISQLRLGTAATETGSYTINGGALNLTGASPSNSPSQGAAGAANTVGDNNLSGGATSPSYIGGGIYVGMDGQGIFNHNGGSVTTNWIVLDNRGDTGAGANMVDGIDRYNLSGASSVLALKSTWGLIQRNLSTAVSFGGGTVKVDNGGTGTGTGANITVPLDATIDTVASTITNLDTNGAGNGLSLLRDVRGTGTLNLMGGGTVNLNTSTVQSISTAITGSTTLAKIGVGITTLNGDMTGFTGTLAANAGQVVLTGNVPTVVVGNAGGLSGGETATVNSLTFGSTGGATLYFDPNTPAALTATNLVVNGTNFLDLTATPTIAGPYTALNYGTKSGTGTFTAANVANYRVAPTVVDTGTAITFDVSGRADLTWTGAASNAWNINNAINWNNLVPEADKFFTADNVTFPEGGANSSVALTGLIAPSTVNVTSTTTAYTFTSTAGNQITGGTGITKTGGSTLTLVGPNTYSGVTSIGGGTVAVSSTNSLGNASPSNSIAISGGGRLSDTSTTAFDFLNRRINVGTGGGSISHNSATATTLTLGGSLTGSGNNTLSFHSQAAGGGTYLLNGDNSGYTGNISIDSVSTGLTSVRLNTPASVPAGGTITINYPVGGVNGNTNTLDLATGRTLPAGLTLSMGSQQSTSAISLRSLVQGNIGTSIINGPIKLFGSSIAQLTVNTPGSITYNNTISELTSGSFTEAVGIPYSNILFFRGNGLHTVNSTITLPSAGSVVANTDGATVLFNVAGNTWKSTNALFGTMRLGVTDALATTARLVVGQGGDQATTVDLNGFDQTVNGLEWQAATGNTLTKGISNSNLTTTSTFTVNQATPPTINANFNGTISGKINFVKEGAATLSLVAPASNFTGNVIVNGGTLSATGAAGASNGTLGNPTVAGRSVTVNDSGTLSLLSNNIFGNGIGNANLPAMVINSGGTVSSTRYNVLGQLTMNGGLLTQAATDGPGTYEGFQFRGGITVGGTLPSTIASTNGKANHLGANTLITVADATGDAAADLTISAPLKNQSGDYASAPGGLTKTGPGTLNLTAANTYSGTTEVSDGRLAVTGSGSIADSSPVNVGGATGVFDISGVAGTSETVANLAGVAGSTVVLGSKTLVYGGNNLPSEFTGAASGTGGSLTKVGTSTSTLSGSNTYTGTTTVSAGTLLLGAANALPDTAALNLSGGTLATGGFSETTGALSVTANSSIDTAATTSILTFADVGTWTGVLNVWNYTGAAWTSGTDKLLFTTGTANINLANVNFYAGAEGDTGSLIGAGGGGLLGNELVPVPEPTAAASLLALLGLIGYKERRRFLHYRK